MDGNDLADIRERLAEWNGLASSTAEQWDDWGRREMEIATRCLADLLAEVERLRDGRDVLLEVCEDVITEARECDVDLTSHFWPRLLYAVAKARGVTDV